MGERREPRQKNIPGETHPDRIAIFKLNPIEEHPAGEYRPTKLLGEVFTYRREFRLTGKKLSEQVSSGSIGWEWRSSRGGFGFTIARFRIYRFRMLDASFPACTSIIRASASENDPVLLDIPAFPNGATATAFRASVFDPRVSRENTGFPVLTSRDRRLCRKYLSAVKCGQLRNNESIVR